MSNNKVRISEQAAEMMKSLSLPVGAQKLLLALIYAQEQTQSGWVSSDWQAYAGVPFYRSLTDLRALGCAPRGDNARFFKNAVAVLGDRPDLFDKITLCTRTGRLTWAFSTQVWQAMAQTDRYGLMEAQEIALLKGRWGLALLTQIVVQRRKKAPEFVLFRPNKGYQAVPDADAALIDLGKVRGPLEAALATWSKQTKCGFVVGYEQRETAPGGYIQARVRFKSPKSVWTSKTLQRFRPNTKVVLITA